MLINMKQLLLVISFSCFSTVVLGKDAPSTSPFVIGEILKFQSKTLNQQRIVNVYLPASYHKSPDNKYPVIYLLDGSADEDFIHVAGTVQFGSFSWINAVPESIVIGIENIDRKHDFTAISQHKLDIKDLPTHGGSGKFIKFLSNELKSLIESKYRISDDSTLVGQSLGGLLATEILFTHADLFDRYVIISPSLWWNDEYWLSIPYQPSSSVKSIYIGVGKEGKLMERVAKGLFTKIKAQSTSTQLNFEYFDTLTHGDVLHNALYDAFKKTNY